MHARRDRSGAGAGQEVRMLFDEEVKVLTAGARITQYVAVIASRRVRQRLRKD